MKRILALLLALLLPGCAVAETYGFSLSVDVDEAAFVSCVKPTLVRESQLAAYDPDVLAAVLAKCLNGLDVEVKSQEDAASLKVSLSKGDMLDLTCHATDEALYYTSPMLAGHALWAEMDAEDEIDELIAKTDWKSVMSGVMESVENWLSNFEPTVSGGVFDGDAYEDGTRCITWSLTDMDIAALQDGMMTDELRGFIRELGSIGLDAAALLGGFDALNARVADEDTYLYILRAVTNDAGEFVGASLTILEENTQVATASLGMKGNAIKLVVGLGLHEQNYWWEFSAKQTQQENISYLSGISREWVADKAESFSYVSATNAPLATYQLRCTLTRTGERILWDGSLSMGSESSSTPLCSIKGSYSPANGAFDCSVALGGKVPFLRLNIRFGQVEPIPAMDASLKLCSMTSNADAALFAELTDKFAAKFMARLIKLLPMDLIMTLEQYQLPQ